MIGEDYRERNRSALLSSEHFDYSGSLVGALDNPDKRQTLTTCTWDITRVSGDPIPTVHYCGTPFTLNSRYDPVREAERIAVGLEKADLIIVLGFEAGYLAHALATCTTGDTTFKRVLCLEAIPELMAETLKNRDLVDLTKDKRFYAACLSTESEFRALISSVYQVHYFSSVRIFYSDATRTLYKALNLLAEDWLAASIREMQSDFLTQAHLGKRWMYNIMCNISMISRIPQAPFPHASEAIVLGAGPSAENQAPVIRSLQKRGALLFASDASLSWCQLHNLQPDVLLSIDGQSISYLHLLGSRSIYGRESGLQVVDLCSHPAYLRQASYSLILGSRHPFIQLLKNHGLDCGELDTAGGNVGYSLVSLALHAGAERIHTFGLDFAYPKGKPYLRPAFFYSAIQKDSSRLQTFEQGVAQLWLDNVLVPVSESADCYRTERMGWYYQTFTNLVTTSSAHVFSYINGQSRHINSEQKQNVPIVAAQIQPAQFSSGSSLLGIMKEIDASLKRLLTLDTSPLELRDGPESEEQQTMFSLLPLIAWHLAFILKTEVKNTDSGKRALQKAVNETRDLISHFFR